MSTSQAHQEVVYLRELFKGFCHALKEFAEMCEHNATCNMMSANPTNRDRSRHVDVRSMSRYTISVTRVRDGHLKLVKCAGPQNVSDSLTKKFTQPAFEP